MNSEVLKNIFKVNLNVKEEERVIVFTDIPATTDSEIKESKEPTLREICSRVAKIGSFLCRVEHLEYESVGSHGVEPPIELWEAAFGERSITELKDGGLMERLLKKKAEGDDLERAVQIIEKYKEDCVDAVIALSAYSTSHTKFRAWLTGIGGARYASMPLFEYSMIDGVMTADWREVERRTKNLVSMMQGAETVQITAPNGTDIRFSVKDRQLKADTGIISEPGSFSNLPAGEGFLAPLEGTAEGQLVLDYAPTYKLDKPVIIELKDGLAINATGGDYAPFIMERLAENPLKGNLAELGIGTNDKASNPENILETEKILGTVHLALGDNSTFGGTVSVPFHQDFIFFYPTLEVTRGDDKFLILDAGRPLF